MLCVKQLSRSVHIFTRSYKWTSTTPLEHTCISMDGLEHFECVDDRLYEVYAGTRW